MANDLNDLNNAITSLETAAGEVSISAQNVQTAAQQAADRVAALPTTPIDYTPQVERIASVVAGLGTSKSQIDTAIATANGIVPATP